jgi:hypothetical protein
MREREQQLMRHGGVVLAIGMLLGLVYAAAIAESWGEDAVGAWRMAHGGVVAAGVALLAMSGALARLGLGMRAIAWLVRAAVGGAYALALGVVLAVTVGLPVVPTAPALDAVLLAAWGFACAGTLVGARLLAGGGHGALRRRA